MFFENPEVTLKEEAFGLDEAKIFTHWSCVCVGYGDDGVQYWIDCNIARHIGELTYAVEKVKSSDMWALAFRSAPEKGTGKVIQSPNSIYKLADFDQVATIAWHRYPFGTLTMKRLEHEVAIDLGDAHVVCKDDKTWQFSIEDKEKGIKAEWTHTAIGYPLWYGKEKPQAVTPHNVAYGYYWSGTIEGTITTQGRKVRIKGKGVRERYTGLDICAAEVGGWHDWIWFHFDEMFGNVWEMKYSKHKQLALYMVDEKQYFQAGSFNIKHHDWAYLRPLGAFIPTRYEITVETSAGVLEMATNVIGFKFWSQTGEVPDAPFSTLDWGKIDGTFTYKDGRKRILTNGEGSTQTRQWKPYPAIFTPEVFGLETDKVKVLPKFD